MRRTCPHCESSYTHRSVTAQGPIDADSKLLLIACSWACLVGDMTRRLLATIQPPAEPIERYLDAS